jgi:glycosyltransferase involved in cell wall biosynthesis
MIIQPFLDATPKLEINPSQFKIDNPIFSIIIPSWNNLIFLKTCIASLNKNSRYKHQIILHLNEGSDGSKEWAEQEGLDFSWSEENIGICYAMNIARTLATSELLVYFNDDMYACPDWDYWMYEEVKKQTSPFYFISATAIEPRYSKNKCVIAPYDYGNHPDNFNEDALLKNFQIPKMHDWNGATWPPSVLPTLLWDMVGGYSTEFSPGMYSDPDFSMKLWQVGVRRFKGVGKSRVYHFMSVSTKKLNKKRKGGSKVFLNKWGISSNLFTNFYLRRGEKWISITPEVQNSLKYQIKKILSNIKKRIT